MSTLTSTTIHGQAYEFYPWEVLGEDAFALAQKIITAEQQFDRVIALAKGGLTFARSILDFLNVKQVSTIQIEFYTGIGTTAKTPIITQSLPVTINGERILIFDDIVDKGDTMKLATDYLRYHGAQSITTAALIAKPWSTFQVDYQARSSEAWVIFPNEIRETINILIDLWTKKGDNPSQIKAQLLQIGFSSSQVALFAKVE